MINMDLNKELAIDTGQMPWSQSPAEGVWRKPLEREAKESGHTTSIVKYEAGKRFSEHPHPLGEEIFVLEGVFSDETGDFPAGTYIRNPPNSRHSPFSEKGCTLFVKLNQFMPHDLKETRINTRKTRWVPSVNGLDVMPLHTIESEHVALVRISEGKPLPLHSSGGEEILVISGKVRDSGHTFPPQSWIRRPHGSEGQPVAEEETVIFLKTGHLLKGE